MFFGHSACVKGGVGQRDERQHLAVVVHRDASRGGGCAPAASSRVDHDAERPQPPVGIEGAVAPQPLGGHADVAQDAPRHVGVDGGLELQEQHQRPAGAVAVSDPPDGVAAPPCAVVHPLAGDVGEGREVEQCRDLGEEAPEQVLDDDGQREELLPCGGVALPQWAVGHLGAPCILRQAGHASRRLPEAEVDIAHALRRTSALCGLRDSPGRECGVSMLSSAVFLR